MSTPTESSNSDSYHSDETDSDSHELQLLAQLRDRTRSAYESEMTLKEKVARYKNKVKDLKNQLSESHTSPQSSESSSRTSNSSPPSTSHKSFSSKSSTRSNSSSPSPISDSVPPKTETHRQYVKELEQYAKVRCSDADQIISYLRTGKRYAIQACFSSSESNELFTKMSEEISNLTITNRRLEHQLQKVCLLAETYSRDHARRQSKRSKPIEDSHRQLCEFICQLFPQYSTPGEAPNTDHCRRILLSVSKNLPN
jgi:hypothetical protein